jgi:hypothetical protein
LNTNLQLHYITTSWESNEASANILVFSIQRAHISWVLVMVNHLTRMKASKTKWMEQKLEDMEQAFVFQ